MKNLLIKSILLVTLITLAQTAFSKESVVERTDLENISLAEIQALEIEGRMPASAEANEFDGKTIDEIFDM